MRQATRSWGARSGKTSPPYTRRLGKPDPKEWDMREGMYEWQQARAMFMQCGVQGAGEEAMSQAALEGVQEGREKAKQGTKSLISFQAEKASEDEIQATLAKLDRAEAMEAKRRLEATKKLLGRVDITNKVGGEAELVIMVKEYHFTLGPGGNGVSDGDPGDGGRPSGGGIPHHHPGDASQDDGGKVAIAFGSQHEYHGPRGDEPQTLAWVSPAHPGGQSVNEPF